MPKVGEPIEHPLDSNCPVGVQEPPRQITWIDTMYGFMGVNKWPPKPGTTLNFLDFKSLSNSIEGVADYVKRGRLELGQQGVIVKLRVEVTKEIIAVESNGGGGR